MKDNSLETGKLPKKFKKDWLRALRSGKFLQATGGLKVKKEDGTIGYCCLGIAGEVAGCRIPTEEQNNEEGQNYAWLGGKTTSGTVKFPIKGYTKVPKLLHGDCEMAEELASMNDNGNTFLEIANYIEREL